MIFNRQYLSRHPPQLTISVQTWSSTDNIFPDMTLDRQYLSRLDPQQTISVQTSSSTDNICPDILLNRRWRRHQTAVMAAIFCFALLPSSAEPLASSENVTVLITEVLVSLTLLYIENIRVLDAHYIMSPKSHCGFPNEYHIVMTDNWELEKCRNIYWYIYIYSCISLIPYIYIYIYLLRWATNNLY